jgi:radical SAM superfamily enzyme YgiQ (UPF0313 family)
MKNILLVNPPVSIYLNKTAFIPLPLLVLGSCLKKIRQEGIDFSYEVIDLDLMLKQGYFRDDNSFYDKAVDLILEKHPDILFFTVHGLNHIVVLNLSARIKNTRPCFIVVGGVGPTLKAREALNRCEHIDVIVKGEGEPVLKRLIHEIFNHRDFSKVPSIVYRKDGYIFENRRCYLDKNEPIPSPDYSLVHIEDYIIHNKKNPYIHPGFVLIESGRGCPNHCSFCAPAKMWEGNVRYRPIAEIIDEMKFLAEKGGNFSFFTQDNLEEKFLVTLSGALIKEKINISWGCYARLDRLADHIADLLSKAGCKLIFTGFETPNISAQKKIRKVINSTSIFEKLKNFNRHGIRLIGSFIAGFSDETEAELEKTMHFAIECAVSQKYEDLEQFIAETDQDNLPQNPNNICVIHPLYYMPGTDSFDEEKEQLHMSKYSLHSDCYGSYLFSYNEFKDDWSFLGNNPYINHLSEDRVRYYCSILRVFNLLNNRPYYFALLLFILKMKPLAFIKNMLNHLGEELVLSEKVEIFEARSIDYIKQYLEFVPEWTVKKGQ